MLTSTASGPLAWDSGSPLQLKAAYTHSSTGSVSFSLDLYFMAQIFLNHLQVHDETLSQIYKISEPP